ncbi:glycosyltransferase family 4 protein [Marisediminicola sp. LYQ134]|uniref:glycosyltransferase family 4 protein n=1 Tax=Marisediminicola sp. LYQ134 TaxID=3391061 RepID=UPI003983600B
MRVAVVSESFLPTVNGVTTSVMKVLDHLRARGHEAIVITPSAGSPSSYAGFTVRQVPAFAYRQFPVGLPSPLVQRIIADFAPDVVHVASPFMLGATALTAAKRLRIPSVAIFQTDVAGYARRNNLAAATGFAWRLIKWIHDGADVTLAPSTASIADLTRAGVSRVERWARGVDLQRYHPRNRSSDAVTALRREVAPRGETIVGYVGRVAPEKQIERLRALRGVANIRIVIVGDGPGMPSVKRALHGMPVTYLGALAGEQLASAYASFDLFVHTGTEETFGQTLQEAHATGLPVVAPRAGGPVDLVTPGLDGYLFDPADDRTLRDAVERLSLDPALRARLGEAGRRRVLSRSWDAVCDELLGHYRTARTARDRKVLARAI